MSRLRGRRHHSRVARIHWEGERVLRHRYCTTVLLRPRGATGKGGEEHRRVARCHRQLPRVQGPTRYEDVPSPAARKTKVESESHREDTTQCCHAVHAAGRRAREVPGGEGEGCQRLKEREKETQ